MRRPALALTACLLMAAPALAAAPSTDEDATIVVTGAGLAAGEGDAAYDVVTIPRDRLAGDASHRLEDVLRDAAGFAQYRRADTRSANPTSEGATLRGLGGNASSRALVLLDGVPQQDPFGGWVAWTALDPRRLGLVTITRGGGSGGTGPGALAGTIALESAGPNDLSPLWAGIEHGSRDSIDADAGVSGRLGGGFAFLSGTYARGDGFVPIARGTRGPADTAAPYRQYSLAARAVFPVAPDVELQASGLGFDDRRARGLAFTPNRTTGADASLRLVGRGRFGFEALAYLQQRTFSSGFASVDATRAVATASSDQYSVPATGAGGRIELRPPVGDRLQLRLGADTRITEGRSDELYTFVAGEPTRGRDAGGRTATVGGFAEASYAPSPAITLTAGGRLDRWWITGGHLHERTLATGAPITDADYPDRHGARPTARGGAAWHPASAITVRAAGYLGWRLPTLNELYRPFRVGADATAANPGLRPERLKGIDGGVDWDPIGTVHVAATLFWNRLADAVANVTEGQGPGMFPGVGFVSAAGRYSVRENIAAIRSRGAEIEGRVAVGDWSLSGSAAYADARVRSSGNAAGLDGLRPAQTPEYQASATLGWARPRGPAGSLTLRYAGRQYEDDLDTLRLKDALTLDATAVLPLGHGFTATARAENLTDALVETTLSTSAIERAQPRTLWIGLRYGG